MSLRFHVSSPFMKLFMGVCFFLALIERYIAPASRLSKALLPKYLSVFPSLDRAAEVSCPLLCGLGSALECINKHMARRRLLRYMATTIKNTWSIQ